MIITTDKKMRPRDPDDFYPTPLAVAKAALELIPALPYFVPYQQYFICDPGAGTGVWGNAAKQRWAGAEIVGYDIREIPAPREYDWWFCETDFLQLKTADTYDLVIGNPPYKFAEKFVRKALHFTKQGGYVQFLLRLAFLEGQARSRGLWATFPPQSVHVLSARPSFIADGDKAGKTDSTAYAIFTWQKGWKGTPTLGWLNWNVEQTGQLAMELGE
jgi:hypothetical protein